MYVHAIKVHYHFTQAVHSITDPEKNSKALDNWITSIK